MVCSCCGKKLNVGMILKTDDEEGLEYKSCPHCSEANGREHVFHPYPNSFGQTEARKTARNPDGYQSYCYDCRGLKKEQMSYVYQNGRTCSSLK